MPNIGDNKHKGDNYTNINNLYNRAHYYGSGGRLVVRENFRLIRSIATVGTACGQTLLTRRSSKSYNSGRDGSRDLVFKRFARARAALAQR